MNNTIRKLLAVALVGANLIASFGIGISPAYAKSYSKNHTMKVDLNNDGKKESVKYNMSGYDGYSYNKLTISINGKKVKTIKTDFFSYDTKTIKLKNKKTFIYLHTSAENEDGDSSLYQYKGGKLTKVINFNKVFGCRWVEGIKVKGNKLDVKMGDSCGSGIGAMRFESIYTYKNGKFKLDSKTHKIISYYNYNTQQNGVFNLTTSQEIKLYSSKTCKNHIDTVPVGTELKVTKVYKTGTTYVNGFEAYYVTGDGYSGWYSSKDVDYEMLFDGVSGVA